MAGDEPPRRIDPRRPAIAWRWHNPTLADWLADDATAPDADKVERLLDPAVLERYLLLLSLNVEAERMLAEYHRELAEIDAAHAALNGGTAGDS
jgi:hypothetical protein